MISIILVNYHVQERLFKCIKSIIDSKPESQYEIIVVDNDEIDTIKHHLLTTFPNVIYIKSTSNVGFGAANNLGAKKAKGKYLFFLNPDTLVYKHTIDSLYLFLEQHKETAIVAPLLHNTKKFVYAQGTKLLTPFRAIIALSFINKYFPNNKISREYWLRDWDRKSLKEVDAVPGTAFVIREKIYRNVNGFDSNFFLYFEEFDLCKRVKELGCSLYILPTAKVQHWGGESTKGKENINTIFTKSRYYYFRKHFGILNAVLVESFLKINIYIIVLFLLFILGLSISLYRLNELMSFIGDYGWFYLSAKDILHNHGIPLVGISTSHPWLHQGALWTYMLAGGLLFFSFSPLSGAYISICFYLATIACLYFIGAEIFSKRFGIIAALLFTCSPLIIITARTPYHTSPIPFFTLIYFYTMYKWISGNKKYVPAIIAILAILYNLEIATFSLAILFIIVVIYGYVTKKLWVKNIIDKKILLLSLLGFFIPMLPMLLYDSSHNFPQTIKFLAWILYKIFQFVGLYPKTQPAMLSNTEPWIKYFIDNYQKLVFLPNIFIAGTIGFFSLINLCNSILRKLQNHQKKAAMLLLLILGFDLTSILIVHTASDAYLPMSFVIIILIIALFYESLLQINKVIRFIVIVVVLYMSYLNVTSLIGQNYLMQKGFGLVDREAISKKIITESHGDKYTIIGGGIGSQFESFTAEYEYLTWWYGFGASEKPEKTKFLVTEGKDGIQIKKLLSK